jgi:hypothetical protein
MSNRPGIRSIIIVIISLALGGSSLVGLAAGDNPASPSSTNSLVSGDVTIDVYNYQEYSPAIAYNWKRDEYMVTAEMIWTDGKHYIFTYRINSQGVLTTISQTSESGHNSLQPDIAYDPVNDRYLVVYMVDINDDGSDYDIYGRFVPWYGYEPTLAEFPIATSAHSEWHPRVAYGRTRQEYMVTWIDHPSSGATYVAGSLVNASNGTPAAPWPISSGTGNDDFTDIAYNLARNEYLVTWDRENYSEGTGLDIYGIRLRGDGAALGGGEFGIAGWPEDEERPAVAACDKADQYLVAWQSDTGSGDYDIYARYIEGDGSLAGVHLVDGTTSPEEEVDVSCDQSGYRYFLTWQSRYTNLEYGIIGRLAYPNELMGSTAEIILPSQISSRSCPGIAGGSINYLIAWEHERDNSAYQDLIGRYYTPYRLQLPLVIKNAP